MLNSLKHVSVLSVLFAVGLAFTAPGEETALDRYIAKPDDSFAWEVKNTIEGDGYTGYVLEMISQTWRSAADRRAFLSPREHNSKRPFKRCSPASN